MNGPHLLSPDGLEPELSSFRSAGGHVEYFLVADTTGSQIEQHKAAAVCAIEDLAARQDRHVEGLIARNGRPRRDSWSVQFNPDRAVGTRVDCRTFLGRGFDWETKRVVSSYEGSGDKRWRMSGGDSPADGYAYAFSDGPYWSPTDFDPVNGWFSAINRKLIGPLTDDLVIYSWSTDWSNWFDVGLEWWGAFMWTVEPVDLPWITVIAASTTD